jgi:hypothetical protein
MYIGWGKEECVDPMIVAAVVNASGGLLGKMIEVYFGGDHDTRTEKQTDRIIQKTYDHLRWNLTGGSVRVLKLLELGSLYYVEMIRKRFYPNLQLPEEHVKTLDSEFRYRLEYLRLHGVVGLVGGAHGEYGITRLGMAFFGGLADQDEVA